jgi:hypothetical protein
MDESDQSLMTRGCTDRRSWGDRNARLITAEGEELKATAGLVAAKEAAEAGGSGDVNALARDSASFACTPSAPYTCTLPSLHPTASSRPVDATDEDGCPRAPPVPARAGGSITSMAVGTAANPSVADSAK